MKFTAYFNSTRQRPDRSRIQLEWIEQVVYHPFEEQVQADGRIRRWARIDAAGGLYPRVIRLPDGETVRNAFFDRNFRP